MNRHSPIAIERAKRAERSGLTPQAALFAARAAARSEYPDIPKNRIATVRMKSGGQYSYKYADLADVFAAINPILSANGLDVSQWPEGLEICTRITHENGGQETHKWPIKPMQGRDLNDAMSFQSAVQVAKRYALTAALGITTEETVEGDPRAQRKARDSQSSPMAIDDKFDTPDGKRLPRGANVTRDMQPRQIAEEVARAIEAQFDDPKTEVGMNGVWNRNEAFIEKLRDKHPDLFDNVFEAFNVRLSAVTSE